jgi:2'-5' RNA ligase
MPESKRENLYFIAIVPPQPIYNEALTWKEHFKTRYNSEAALNSPPHITLHMPFKFKESKERSLIEALERFAAQHNPVEIELNNFNVFEPRVIFIDVIKNEKLEALQRQLKRFCKVELNLFNADYKELAFHPHITLAFRDLKKPAFYEAWGEFKERKFEATFVTNEFVLLKHDGTLWNVFKAFSLESSSFTNRHQA